MIESLILISCALIGGFIGAFVGYLVMYKAWKIDGKSDFK